MAVKVTMYQHDLKPDLVVRCTYRPDPDVDTYAPVDLTVATAIRVIGVASDGTVVVDRAGTGDSLGNVTMLWEPEDTATVALLRFEVEVMWPGNKPQTFRPPETINIVADYA